MTVNDYFDKIRLSLEEKLEWNDLYFTEFMCLKDEEELPKLVQQLALGKITADDFFKWVDENLDNSMIMEAAEDEYGEHLIG